MDGSGEFLGGEYNERNHLIALRYAGFSVCTFVNSHYDRTYFAGISRELHSSQHGPGIRIDTGYDLGLMYGYKDNLPNIGGLSPKLRFTMGMAWRRLGVDLGWAPVSVATLNFRIDLQ